MRRPEMHAWLVGATLRLATRPSFAAVEPEDLKMLKLTVAVLAVALAGTASAGWRSMRVDGSSEDGFNRSVTALRQELPEVRRHVFDLALQDIWVQGTKTAEAEQREYTATEYLRELDGLGYKEIVTLLDPTGDTADERFALVYARLYMGSGGYFMSNLHQRETYSTTAERHYPTPQDDERQSCGQCR